ncbi:MAG: hypothetical protein NTW64_01120 [Candidatus Omnitrophica bacterium]|nr:hypothetical protein [Candidatus Omnitrophota bacterium]
MRDLIFKNLTSYDKKRKILASSEIMDTQGMRRIIHRHFVCIVKPVQDTNADKPLPYLYVLKKKGNLEHKEKFFCRIKGSLFAVANGRLFLILFMHSLKIDFSVITQGSAV